MIDPTGHRLIIADDERGRPVVAPVTRPPANQKKARTIKEYKYNGSQLESYNHIFIDYNYYVKINPKEGMTLLASDKKRILDALTLNDGHYHANGALITITTTIIDADTTSLYRNYLVVDLYPENPTTISDHRSWAYINAETSTGILNDNWDMITFKGKSQNAHEDGHWKGLYDGYPDATHKGDPYSRDGRMCDNKPFSNRDAGILAGLYPNYNRPEKNIWEWIWDINW